jgi:hypothetical protein
MIGKPSSDEGACDDEAEDDMLMYFQRLALIPCKNYESVISSLEAALRVYIV